MPKEIPDELAFARWLQIERGVIGEDVDLVALHAQWNEWNDAVDLYCNHDPAALRVVEINRCECGALLPLLADEPEPARTYDHDADPSDDPELGNRCKDCGEAIVWLGPGPYDWLHVNDVRNR